jgi:hypothetical protein
MSYKSDKHKIVYDPVIVSYTQRRIRELRGENSPVECEPMHPYIRKRLDEIKKLHDEE